MHAVGAVVSRVMKKTQHACSCPTIVNTDSDGHILNIDPCDPYNSSHSTREHSGTFIYPPLHTRLFKVNLHYFRTRVIECEWRRASIVLCNNLYVQYEVSFLPLVVREKGESRQVHSFALFAPAPPSLFPTVI